MCYVPSLSNWYSNKLLDKIALTVPVSSLFEIAAPPTHVTEEEDEVYIEDFILKRRLDDIDEASIEERVICLRKCFTLSDNQLPVHQYSIATKV